ncbi:hypothetical protein P5V15_004332 [Pogonomyrmex californicus]
MLLLAGANKSRLVATIVEISTKKDRRGRSISVERRAVRLLSRRYTLTATGYKFLEIGINIGPPSYVEIALGDYWGQELILSLKTWTGLYEQLYEQMEYLQIAAKRLQR